LFPMGPCVSCFVESRLETRPEEKLAVTRPKEYSTNYVVHKGTNRYDNPYPNVQSLIFGSRPRQLVRSATQSGEETA